jgi:hypothetical protein
MTRGTNGHSWVVANCVQTVDDAAVAAPEVAHDDTDAVDAGQSVDTDQGN